MWVISIIERNSKKNRVFNQRQDNQKYIHSFRSSKYNSLKALWVNVETDWHKWAPMSAKRSEYSERIKSKNEYDFLSQEMRKNRTIKKNPSLKMNN